MAAGIGIEMLCRAWEYETHAGQVEYLVTDATGVVWSSKDGGSNWDIIGTIDDPYAQMVNFKDKMYIFQDVYEPYVYDGTTFEVYTDGGSPTVTGHNGIALSAFGRMWAATDKTFITYCALLDETDWDFANPESSAGGFELKNVWEGTDIIQAMVEHNGSLVVFGRNNIVVWSDGEGSDVGMNPLGMYVVDIVHGVGCRARDSVVEVNGDLWWLSDSGVQNLSRVIEQRSSPLKNLSYYVEDSIRAVADSTDPRQVQAVYSPEERFVEFSFPDATQGDEGGLAFIFDSRGFMEDGSARCIGIWNTLVPKTFLRKANKDILLFCGEAGPFTTRRTFTENVAGIYSGHIDPLNQPTDPIVPYVMEYQSAWNNFETPYIKMPKKMRTILYALGSTEIGLTIRYDFDDIQYNVYNEFINADASPDHWTSPTDGAGVFLPVTPEGIEWNNTPNQGVDDQQDGNAAPVQAGEWSGAFKPIIVNIPSVQGTGEYVRIGFTGRIIGYPLSIQEISLYIKQGRLV
jgi:hypothetical protein